MRITQTPPITINVSWAEAKTLLSTLKYSYIEVTTGSEISLIILLGPFLGYIVALSDAGDISEWSGLKSSYQEFDGSLNIRILT